MFSQTVEYALRAVVHLASESPELCTTDRISVATKVPKPYLTKVLQGLADAGVVVLRRGLGGGVQLARPPAELTLLDVVNAVDPIRRIKTCPLELRSHGVRLCPLHFRLDQALASIEDAFRRTTLAELLAEDTGSRPLCDSDAQSTDNRPQTSAKRTQPAD